MRVTAGVGNVTLTFYTWTKMVLLRKLPCITRLVFTILCVLVLCISVRTSRCGSSSSIYCDRNPQSPFATNSQPAFTEQKLLSITDSQFILIFKEHTPLLYFTEGGVNGLSWSGFTYTRLGFVFVYALLTCLRGSLYYLDSLYLRHFLHRKYKLPQNRRLSIRKIRRKIRWYLAISKQRLLMHIFVAPLFSTLLLCGDIHPHPGPVLPGNTRHPELRFLNVATWNVRTLLETRRTPVRPSAIVASELARYNIDIAALSETRILGESVIEEVGGGYTFFLKGKPKGDKHYHGVGFAIRTRLVKHLDRHQ